MRSKILTYRGFTLIELVVAIALLGIIMAIAMPSFTSIIQNNYAVSVSNNLVESLLFARSEAIKRNSPVTVCATADTNFNTCGSEWATGWLIFSDTNGNGILNSGSDTLLRIERLTGQNMTLSPSPSTNAATYNNVGFPMPNAANVTFQVNASGCKGDYIRNINISLTGRVTVTSANCP